MVKTRKSRLQNIQELQLNQTIDFRDSFDSTNNKNKKKHVQKTQSKNRKKFYTLDEDLMIIKMSLIYDSKRFIYENLQQLLTELSDELGRTIKSVQRRREKLQKLTNTQKNQIFKYVQLFPKLAQKRKLLIIKDTQIVYQDINGQIVDPQELKKIRENMSSSESLKKSIEGELKAINYKDIMKRKKKIKKKSQTIQEFLDIREITQETFEQQKQNNILQNEIDKKTIKSFMKVYLNIFFEFPDKIVIDFKKKEVQHQFKKEAFINQNKSFFEVIDELKEEKQQLERTKESRTKSNKSIVCKKEFIDTLEQLDNNQQKPVKYQIYNEKIHTRKKQKIQLQNRSKSQQSLQISEKSFQVIYCKYQQIFCNLII